MCLLPASWSLVCWRGKEDQAEQDRGPGPGGPGGGCDSQGQGWTKNSWMHLPNAVFLDPQGAVSLSNKVAHCLLHAMSPHHNTCHHVWYPAVPGYWKHFNKIYYNRPLLD